MGANMFEFKSKVRVAISAACNLSCAYCDNSHIQSKDRIISMEDFRRTPVNAGCISTEEYIEILRSFFRSGFRRVNFTGGEPMLNRQWDIMVKQAKNIGFESVEMTTNGTLLGDYLDRKGSLPVELDRLIVSIDTYDPNDYRLLVGKDVSLKQVCADIRRTSTANNTLKLTANCVLTKSKRVSLAQYLDFVAETGFDNVTFLDLVVRDSSNKKEIDYFKKEYFSGKEIKEEIFRLYGALEVLPDRHDYNVILPNGLNVSVVDTQGFTRRDAACNSCERFCQEGYYTAKVATDGNIIDCLGAGGISIDGISALHNGTLDSDLRRVYDRLAKGQQGYYFDQFLRFISG